MTETPKVYIFVYQTICQINGKSYIGVHKTKRLNDGYIGNGIYSPGTIRFNNQFHKAVRKYGYENFKVYILDYFETYAAALEEERCLVTKEWVKNRNNYNSAIGGKGGFLEFMSDEEKRDIYIRRAATATGRKLSDIHRDNLRKNHKGATGIKWTEERKAAHIKNHTGYRASDETKRKLSQSHLGQVSVQRKPICQYDLNGHLVDCHDSLSSASVKLNCLRTSISNNLSGRTKMCSGFTFKYKEV